jgi:hypothetical protein
MSEISELAENKLILMYFLDKMDIPISMGQLHEFAVAQGYMDYFMFQQYIHELVDNKLAVTSVENKDTYYTLTAEGSVSLHYFMKQIPEDKVEEIIQYIRKNRNRIKRDYEVCANIFSNGPNDHLVKCGVYNDDGTALVELNVSVANMMQAKTVSKNWKKNVTSIYGMILNNLLDDKDAEEMKNELETNLNGV